MAVHLARRYTLDADGETAFREQSDPGDNRRAARTRRQALHLRTHQGRRHLLPDDTRSAEAADIIQSHTSLGFDHTGIYRDINVTFPIDRLQELVDQKKIGSLSDNYYSFMGALRHVTGIIEESGPEVARKLKDEGVDVVLLTPT